MQINPHFLFNCLHSISALATQDGARAREMCVRLADFLRGSLGLGLRESIPLSEELGLARSYLEVERVRFGARLRVEEEIESGCEDCAVPALLLQPLVENAVKHGIAGLVDGGSIRLAVRRGVGVVTIAVENGFDPEMPPPSKSGMGLKHVRRRLQVRYGDDAEMEAGPVQPPPAPPVPAAEPAEGVYRVVLRLPCGSPMASSSRA
jgi:LytS/YehU family sensor histidine kinase